MNKSREQFYGGVTETLLVSALLILVTVIVIRDHAGIMPLFVMFALAITAFRKGPKIGVAGSPISLIVLLAFFAAPLLVAVLAVVRSPLTLLAATAVTIAYVALFVVRRCLAR